MRIFYLAWLPAGHSDKNTLTHVIERTLIPPRLEMIKLPLLGNQTTTLAKAILKQDLEIHSRVCSGGGRHMVWNHGRSIIK